MSLLLMDSFTTRLINYEPGSYVIIVHPLPQKTESLVLILQS